MNYTDLLKNIEYVPFIASCAKWLLLFLVISILVLVVTTKFNLLQRRTMVAKILVKAYYLLIPLYFVIFACKYGPIKNVQHELNHIIDDNTEMITDLTCDFLTYAVSDKVLAQKHSAKDIVTNYLNSNIQQMDNTSDLNDLNFIERLVFKMKRKIEFSFLSSIVESKVIKETTSLIGIKKQTGEALYETDLYALFKDGEIVDIFKMELNHFFRHIYRTLFLMFGLGLLLPAFEIALSKALKY